MRTYIAHFECVPHKHKNNLIIFCCSLVDIHTYIRHLSQQRLIRGDPIVIVPRERKGLEKTSRRRRGAGNNLSADLCKEAITP